MCPSTVMGGRVLPREKGCLHPHIYVRTNIHTRTHTHRHACMHTYLHAHKHTRARVCLCGCVHVSTCTRTHIHTYIDALAHTSKCERGRTSKRKSRDQGRLGHRTRRHFFLGTLRAAQALELLLWHSATAWCYALRRQCPWREFRSSWALMRLHRGACRAAGTCARSNRGTP